MVANLNNGCLDVAIALTEGLVLARERGDLKNTKIVSVFVESPLQWGIHVSGKSHAKSVNDLDPKTCRIAISRQLSGSHLMSWVFAKYHGFDRLFFLLSLKTKGTQLEARRFEVCCGWRSDWSAQGSFLCSRFVCWPHLRAIKKNRRLRKTEWICFSGIDS
jgi:hypothetical protein